MINRRKTRKIMVGNVAVGGDAPISVQSMTNTLTADAKATIEQIRRQEVVGCDITRCSCPDEASALALKEITKAVNIPVVGNGDIYTAEVESFTHKNKNQVIVSKKFLSKDDHILIVDDFLANGCALQGLISISEAAGAVVEGIGIATILVLQ